jgi:hypothetical protein
MSSLNFIKVQDLIIDLESAQDEHDKTVAARDKANAAIPALATRIDEIVADIRTELAPILSNPFAGEEPATIAPETPEDVAEEPAETVTEDTTAEGGVQIVDVVVHQPVEEPVIEEPATDAQAPLPVIETEEAPAEPVAEAPVEAPTEEPVAEAVVETPVAEPVAVEAPAETVAADPVIETEEVAVEEAPAEPVIETETAVTEEPIAEAPVEEATAAEEVIAQLPAEPTTEAPAPVVDQDEADPTVFSEAAVEEAPAETAVAAPTLFDGDPSNGTEEMISFGLFPMAPYDFNREFHPVMTSQDDLNFTWENVVLTEDDITFKMEPALATSGGLNFEGQKQRGWRDGGYATVVETPEMVDGMIATPLALVSDGAEAFGYSGDDKHKYAIELLGRGNVRFTLDNGNGPLLLTSVAYDWGNTTLFCEIIRVSNTNQVSVDVTNLDTGETILSGIFSEQNMQDFAGKMIERGDEVPNGLRWPFDVPMYPRIIYTVDSEVWGANLRSGEFNFVHHGYETFKVDTHNPAGQ